MNKIWFYLVMMVASTTIAFSQEQKLTINKPQCYLYWEGDTALAVDLYRRLDERKFNSLFNLIQNGVIKTIYYTVSYDSVYYQQADALIKELKRQNQFNRQALKKSYETH